MRDWGGRSTFRGTTQILLYVTPLTTRRDDKCR